jgi:Sugar (and other) transporter
MGLYGTLFVLAMVCVAGAVFVAVYVPETRNRSIEEIQEVMAK